MIMVSAAGTFASIPLRTSGLGLRQQGAEDVVAGATTREGATTVFLLRHAEKDRSVADDPPLTPAGSERARALADLLEEAGITAIHTTDFRRTRDTVLPLAGRIGQEPGIYDARLLPVLAERIRSTPGRHVGSGHSDTTPDMVRLLGGEPGPPIEDEGENDRLYVLTLHPDGTATTVLLRYGERFRDLAQDP